MLDAYTAGPYLWCRCQAAPLCLPFVGLWVKLSLSAVFMQLFCNQPKKKKDICFCNIAKTKKNLVSFCSKSRKTCCEREQWQNDFYQSTFVAHKAHFRKTKCWPLFICSRVYWQVTFSRACTFVFVENRLCSCKALIKPETIGDPKLLSGYPETLKVMLMECLTFPFCWRGGSLEASVAAKQFCCL